MAKNYALEKHIDALAAMQATSAKTLDDFANTSRAIAERARRIVADVQSWEVACDNISLMIEEASKAARCYHPPQALRLVLSGKDKSPEALCKCIDYLVYTDDYLMSHPSNPLGSQIVENTTSQLEKVACIAENVVKEAFIAAMQGRVACKPEQQRRNTITIAAKPSSLTKLFRDPQALQGIDTVIARLGEGLNRTDGVALEVKQLISERMLRLVKAQLEQANRDEELHRHHDVTVRQGFVPSHRRYQKGSHHLLATSAHARGLVGEMVNHLRQFVMQPLGHSYDVVEIPGELAVRAFDCVMEKCFELVELEKDSCSQTSVAFVVSNGESVSPTSGNPTFSDAIFIGLDLVEELWKWRGLSDDFSEDGYTFTDHVYACVERFIGKLSNMLHAYQKCKGALEMQPLKEYTRRLQRTEWYMSHDCSAHMLTCNEVYMHKTMLSKYYGAAKLALQGTQLDSASETEALQKLSSFMMCCVRGTIQDLQIVAEATMELIREKRSEQTRGYKFLLTSGAHDSTGRNNRVCVPVFMVNNISLLMGSYRNDSAFRQRQTHHDVAGDEERQKDVELPFLPGVSDIISFLEGMCKRFIRDFAASWSDCFPRVDSNPKLVSMSGTDAPLSKSQRMVVKHWYRDVAKALTVRVTACYGFTVSDPLQRNALIEAAVTAVQGGFNAFEEFLRGRTWSKRPIKWMLHTPEEWAESLKRSF
ncbi:hypothetical protein ERJ75_001744800 [Trypanosoma vivax]|uniref:Exocyst subunit Exo70 family protein n=1 Tax=Trypanosoma vivax (strain Y486) TaxID=1055687 RepID=G0U2R0_TRYVY|nr:hypothetical protein TRVL_02038 [Trypanosoma vivax]KAH8604083.1 hypothetical protein ERJ75_001744800 [Trypanosoma vivax]CCC50564.1 conserved hypothetical protein [Trypanosoma vivax Y486]